MTFIPHCKMKKKCKAGPKEVLLACAGPGCSSSMHFSCSTLRMNYWSLEIDKEKQQAFCTKTCHVKWQTAEKKEARVAAAAEKEANKGKKKIPWGADGAFEALMAWLTTQGNYSNYCGGNGNKGISKSAHQKEIALIIKEKLPHSNRTDKDVENKIGALERQFGEAYDWSINTGAGVDDPGDFETAALKRCAVFKELELIMLDRPNTGPLATNEDHLKKPAVEDLLEDLSEDGKMPPLLHVLPNVAAEAAAHPPMLFLQQAPGAVPAASRAPTPSSLKKRLSAPLKKESAKKGKGKGTADNPVAFLFGSEGMQAVRSREAAAKEMEAAAKDMVAKADVLKIQKETELIAQQAVIAKLEARVSLLEKGVSQEDIDRMLPLE